MPVILLSSLLVFILSVQILSSQTVSARIIPAPQSVFALEGKFKITSATRIVLGEETTRRDRFAAALINETLHNLKDVALRIVSEESVRRFSTNFIFIGAPTHRAGKQLALERRIVLRPEMNEEGYALDVRPEGIVILAASQAGRFYGIQSLCQLIEREKKTIVVSSCSATDWPRFSFRGVSLQFPSSPAGTEEFRNDIRRFARLKLNAVVLALPLNSSFMDKTIQEIEEFARQNSFQIIPRFTANDTLAERMTTLLQRFHSSTALVVTDEAFTSEIAIPPTVWEKLRRSKKKFVVDTTVARLFSSSNRSSSNEFLLLASSDQLKNGKGTLPTRKNGAVRSIVSVLPVSTWFLFPHYNRFERDLLEAIDAAEILSSLGTLISIREPGGLSVFPELEQLGIAWAAEAAWSGRFSNRQAFSERFFETEFRSENAALHAQACYALLDEPSALVSWNQFFGHPLLTAPTQQENDLAYNIQSRASLVAALARQLEVSALQNRSHARRLSDVAGLLSWFARSQTIVQQIHSSVSSKRGLHSTSRKEVGMGIRELESTLDSLVRLLPRTPFNATAEHFRPLQRWWARIHEEIEQGEAPSIPLLSSAWIGNGQPDSVPTAERRTPETLYFRRDFETKDSLRTGWLQVISRSSVRVWLNGVLVEQSSPTSGSPTDRAFTLALYDLLPHLRLGPNCLAAEVCSPPSENSPPLNAFAVLTSLHGPSVEILSDSSWFCSRLAVPKWQTLNSDSLSWGNASVEPNPVVALRPDFTLRRVSWIGSTRLK